MECGFQQQSHRPQIYQFALPVFKLEIISRRFRINYLISYDKFYSLMNYEGISENDNFESVPWHYVRHCKAHAVIVNKLAHKLAHK